MTLHPLRSAVFCLAALVPVQQPARVQPAVSTAPVSVDPDDPSIWRNAARPSESLVIATNKAAAPLGALVVFSLDGRIRQTVDGLDRPNNVDVEYGFLWKGRKIDIAVATERNRSRLVVYRVDGKTPHLSRIGATPVFAGEQGEASLPMGVSLYRRPRDGAIFAIVSRKTGPREGYLWQYRLRESGGRLTAEKVREFGRFSGIGEIEAVAVDDESGYVYYADEGDGIHKWHADPDHREAGRELAHFGRSGFMADREGIAVYARRGGAGYLLCTDQIEGGSRYLVYRREGKPNDPHDHSELVKIIEGGADSTDGIEATSADLGPAFPAGLLVVMNSGGKNFLLYRWDDIARAGDVRLAEGR